MPFRVSWATLVDELDALPEGATLRTPLSHKRFRISDVLEDRVIVVSEPTPLLYGIGL